MVLLPHTVSPKRCGDTVMEWLHPPTPPQVQTHLSHRIDQCSQKDTCSNHRYCSCLHSNTRMDLCKWGHNPIPQTHNPIRIYLCYTLSHYPCNDIGGMNTAMLYVRELYSHITVYYLATQTLTGKVLAGTSWEARRAVAAVGGSIAETSIVADNAWTVAIHCEQCEVGHVRGCRQQKYYAYKKQHLEWVRKLLLRQ